MNCCISSGKEKLEKTRNPIKWLFCYFLWQRKYDCNELFLFRNEVVILGERKHYSGNTVLAEFFEIKSSFEHFYFFIQIK